MENYPYRISTITATGSVNSEIDLDIFYDNLEICTDNAIDGVIYAEYGKKKSDTIHKGFCKKCLINKRKISVKSKRFDNQVTIVYRRNEVRDDVIYMNMLNIKVFRNGNVQITGIKYIEQGSIMIDIIIQMLRDIAARLPSIVDTETLKNANYKVRLINSDFKIGFPVKRELLHKMFCRTYDHDCSFEPCIYPGVKIQYFYNESNIFQNGLCRCTSKCEVGKGNGIDDKSCKKITIAVFQSGSIIITGAHNHKQIQKAYTFITNIMLKHRDDIEKKNFLQTQEVKVVRKVLINKQNIVYP